MTPTNAFGTTYQTSQRVQCFKLLCSEDGSALISTTVGRSFYVWKLNHNLCFSRPGIKHQSYATCGSSSQASDLSSSGQSDIQYDLPVHLFSSFFKYNFPFFIQDLFYISDNLEKRCSLAGPYIKYGVITWINSYRPYMLPIHRKYIWSPV